MVTDRPDWTDWFLIGADWAAMRGDCLRSQVGAVIVRDRRVIATGYNGTIPGQPGCLEGACPRGKSGVPPGSQYDHGEGACIAIHAELNAVLYAAKAGISVDGAEMYVTRAPCPTCQRLVSQAGIQTIYFRSKGE